MPTIVGGWLTAKKRGRDDEVIERDRSIARQQRQDEIKKRKQLQQQARGKKTLVDEATVSLTKRGRAEEEEKSSEKIHNVYPQHRQRQRKQISSKRELFSKEEPGEVKKKRGRKGRNDDLLGERERGEHKYVTLKQQKQQSGIKGSSSSMIDHRKRKIIVTPEAKIDDLYEYDYAANNDDIKHKNRRRRKSKILFAEEGDLVFSTTTPIVDAPYSTSKKQREGRHRSPPIRKEYQSKISRRQKQPQQQQERDNVRLELEPDFAKSAKYLYETIQRKRVVVTHHHHHQHQHQQHHQQNEAMIGTEYNHVTITPSAPLYMRQFGKNPNHLHQQLEHNSANAIVGKSNSSSSNMLKTRHMSSSGGYNNDDKKKHIPIPIPIRCRRHHSFLRKLLLGTSSSSNSINSNSNSNNNSNATTLNTADEIQSQFEDSVKKYVVNTTSSIQIKMEMDHQTQLGTQRKYTNSKMLNNVKERNRKVIESSKQMNVDDAKGKNEKSVRSSSFKKDVDANLSCKLNSTGNPLLLSNDNNDDDTQPQNQSISSSVMLSLPMNATYSSQLTTTGSNNDDNDKNGIDDYFMKEYVNRYGASEKESASVEEQELGRVVVRIASEMDPLTDIGYWQRIVENEERKKNNGGGGATSFRHTLASMILAKNLNNKKKIYENNDSDHRSHDDGYSLLWLPSILEGGLDHIGPDNINERF